jgi:hypothetical protein
MKLVKAMPGAIAVAAWIALVLISALVWWWM